MENTGNSLSHSLSEWFETPLGRYLLAREQAWFDSTVDDIFGFHALQIGQAGVPLLRACRMPRCFVMDVEEPASLIADPAYLPFAENALDLVLLPHVLEFTPDPHQILREAYRVVRPEGQLIISCFNPFSLWGAKRYFGDQSTPPWTGQFVGLYRMKDWLSLLGFEVLGGRLDCYVPPFSQHKWLERFAFFEKAGDRWWPIAGAVYFLRAVKRVAAMRIIHPAWSGTRKKSLATAVRPVRRGAECHERATPK